jgi:translation initiation factor IF-3
VRVTDKDGPRVNQDITAANIRLVDENGEMVGVVTRNEGLQHARRAGLDLVEVSPNAEPPVCKILDYGKYKYELQKKKNEAKKKQKVVELKEVQLRPMIDSNDLNIKCKAIDRFLHEGNKVKIVMRFRGRELSHQEIGMGILMKIKEQFEEIAKVEHMPKLEGRQIMMVLSPGVQKAP